MFDVTVALLAILFAIWIVWRWKYTSHFSDLGIPGPRPNLIFGNIIELYMKGPIKCHEEWVRKYGRIVGYYYGMKRVLLVADPQMLKNIYIKDFNKFVDREPFNPIYAIEKNEEMHEPSILVLRGQKWKEVRSILTPTFTTAKLKTMAVTMNSAIETMLDVLRKKAESGEVFDIHDTYQRLTMDVISRTAFGVLVDVQKNMQSPLLKATKILFRAPYVSPFIFIGLCFPLLRKAAFEGQRIFSSILFSGVNPYDMLRNEVKDVIAYRRSNPETGRKPDLLQLMLDTKITEGGKKVDLGKLEAGDAADQEVSEIHEDKTKAKYMSDGEIIASSVIVLLAGYETTSTALAFTTYLLAKHQGVQEKAFKEIAELVNSGEKLEYATINKLPYLDKVFNESMRIYPPVHLFTNRISLVNVQYGPLKIPEGTIIQAPCYFLHHDPDYWPDPETFNPDRFDTKPNSDGITFFPFGIGPRNCLGMRFAQMEAKLALAHTIYQFKLQLSDEMKDEIFQFSLKMRTITPSKGVKVKLEIRDKETEL